MHSEPPEPPAGADRPGALPLCVDLDGTLLATDSLHELCVALAIERPRDLVRLPRWTLGGRAHLKARLAERVSLRPELLPYHEEVVRLVRESAGRGRPALLVTAADRRTAEAIAAHVGGFAEVLGSDGEANLKGARKAAALEARFGAGGFEYLGDAAADLPVWEAAGGASLVGDRPGLRRAVAERMPVRRALPGVARRRGDAFAVIGPGPLVDALGVFLAAPLGSPPWAPGRLATAFVTFAVAGASLAILDRLLALPADRAQPERRDGPLAAGRVSILQGVVAEVALALLACGLAAAVLGPAGLGAVAAFLALGAAAALAPQPAPRVGRWLRRALCVLGGAVASGLL